MASPSVLKGLITNEGLAQTIRAANNGGWAIYPTGFAISDEMGEISVARSMLSLKPTWYEAPISGRIIKSVNTIEFLCTIPPSVSADVMGIKELYIFAETEDNEQFLLAICGIEGEASYDPSGSLKLRVLITLQNIDLMDLYVFKYTQAAEIEDHNNDPNAHPDLLSAIVNATNPVIITNNYVTDLGDTIFVDSSNGPVEISLPTSDLRLGSRVTVYDVGWKCDTEGYEIFIVAPNFNIDRRSTKFKLDFKGGGVEFLFYPQFFSWMVNICGRFYMEAGKQPATDVEYITYTEFLDSSWLTFNGTPVVITINENNYHTSYGETVFVDTTGGNVTVWLPVNPPNGARVQVIDTKNYFDVIEAIAKGQGNKVAGSLDDYLMTVKGGIYNFIWDELANEWRVTLSGSLASGGEGGGGSSEGTMATIPVMKGATALVAGAEGLVPTPAAGKQNSFLRGDGSWANSVTSINGRSPNANGAISGFVTSINGYLPNSSGAVTMSSTLSGAVWVYAAGSTTGTNLPPGGTWSYILIFSQDNHWEHILHTCGSLAGGSWVTYNNRYGTYSIFAVKIA